MISPLLALFARSVREDTRLKLTYFSRVALVLIILLFMFTVESEAGWSNAPGLEFFTTVTIIDGFFIVLAAVGYFASVITEEKEEMTLGLLRMTNLNPLSILLGKSTSRLVGALLLLVAQLPFTMLAVTLGGISLRQILATYCTLGSFLVLLANLALLSSVISRRTLGASVLTMGGLALFFAIVPLLSLAAHLPAQFGLISDEAAWVAAFDRLAELAHTASPVTRLSDVLSTGFDGRIVELQAGACLLLGGGCFVLAWLLFDVFCSEQKEVVARRGGAARKRAWLRALSAGRVWGNALAWKDFYFLGGGKRWLLVKLIIYGLPLLAMACWPERWGGPPPPVYLGYIAMWIMWVAFCVEMAFIAASVFKTEVQQKTLSSLAMLPASLPRLAVRKVIGVLPALIPSAFYFFVGLLCVVLWSSPVRGTPNVQSVSLEAIYSICLTLAFMLSHSAFFLALTANLSLRIKRGALPLAIGIDFVLCFFFGFLFAAIVRSREGLIPLVVMSVIACAVLCANIFSQLETLAAEES